MDEHICKVASLDLVGGNLCLDFANTLNWRDSPEEEETLTSYAALVAWSVHAGILTESEAAPLLDESARDPTSAEAVLNHATALRERIYRVFSAVAAGRAPAGDDLDALNDALSEAFRRSRLVQSEQSFAWASRADVPALDSMLWPILRAAADLLTAPDLDRVRRCASDECNWLFLDMSRNRSRRWCSMQDCGNRAKARRFYARKQKH